MNVFKAVSKAAVAFGAIALLFCAPGSAQLNEEDSLQPVLVELFTSQCCRKCPPADQLLSELKSRPGVVALAWHVDYGDMSGWRDPFSRHAFSERQISYARKFENEHVYTPQMIIDGRAEFNGNDRDRVRAAIEDASTRTKSLIRLEADCSEENRDLLLTIIRIHPFPPAHSEQTARVILVITEDNLRVSIADGENRSRTLKHDAVVRWARVVGETDGDAFEESIRVPIEAAWKRVDLRLVAFAQQRSTKHVLGVASIPLNDVLADQEEAP